MMVILGLLIVTSYSVAENTCTDQDFISRLVKCKPHKQTLEECIPRSIDSLKTFLESGCAELDIPSFEPYHMNENIKFTPSDPLFFTLVLRNIVINGLSRYAINKVLINPEATRIEFEAYFSNIQFNAFYKAFPVSWLQTPMEYGSGVNEIKGQFARVRANIVLQGDYNREKRGHFRVYKANVRLNSDQSATFNTRVTNKSDTNYRLSLFTSRYLKTRTSEVLSTIENVAAKIIMILANKIFTYFPIRMLMSFD